MRTAAVVLNIIQERGKRKLPIEDLYRQLYNPDLYLRAYAKLYPNKGTMTKGSTEETVDAMAMIKIGKIIDDLRHERYRWTPVRRVYITKKNGKLRPLGLPVWSDKRLAEVIRLILDAFYDGQFSERSHGFRPGRGCHTAFQEICHTWDGVTWIIEGDISDCFGSLDHDLLLLFSFHVWSLVRPREEALTSITRPCSVIWTCSTRIPSGRESRNAPCMRVSLLQENTRLDENYITIYRYVTKQASRKLQEWTRA